MFTDENREGKLNRICDERRLRTSSTIQHIPFALKCPFAVFADAELHFTANGRSNINDIFKRRLQTTFVTNFRFHFQFSFTDYIEQ